jgi:hypothetical protein
MIQAIKSMILRKRAFVEDARLIFEDTTIEDDLDKAILLEAEEENVEEKGKEDEEKSPEPKEDEGEPEMDLLDEPTNDTGPSSPPTSSEDDVASSPETDMEPSSLGSSNDSAVDDIADLLTHVDLDLKTNTLGDILPVPPSNASEAISDDTLDPKVKSGFGDESSTDQESLEMESTIDLFESNTEETKEEDDKKKEKKECGNEKQECSEDAKNESFDTIDLLSSNIYENKEEDKKEDEKTEDNGKKKKDKYGKMVDVMEGTVDLLDGDFEIDNDFSESSSIEEGIIDLFDDRSYTEAITLAGGGDSAPAGDAPADGNLDPPDEANKDLAADSGGGGEDSTVTSAVKDKVAEVTASPVADGKSAKDTILDQLDKLDKNLLGVKDTVKKALDGNDGL